MTNVYELRMRRNQYTRGTNQPINQPINQSGSTQSQTFKIWVFVDVFVLVHSSTFYQFDFLTWFYSFCFHCKITLRWAYIRLVMIITDYYYVSSILIIAIEYFTGNGMFFLLLKIQFWPNLFSCVQEIEENNSDKQNNMRDSLVIQGLMQISTVNAIFSIKYTSIRPSIELGETEIAYHSNIHSHNKHNIKPKNKFHWTIENEYKKD